MLQVWSTIEEWQDEPFSAFSQAVMSYLASRPHDWGAWRLGDHWMVETTVNKKISEPSWSKELIHCESFLEINQSFYRAFQVLKNPRDQSPSEFVEKMIRRKKNKRKSLEWSESCKEFKAGLFHESYNRIKSFLKEGESAEILFELFSEKDSQGGRSLGVKSLYTFHSSDKASKMTEQIRDSDLARVRRSITP